jgi:hypothetical protein
VKLYDIKPAEGTNKSNLELEEVMVWNGKTAGLVIKDKIHVQAWSKTRI